MYLCNSRSAAAVAAAARKAFTTAAAATRAATQRLIKARAAFNEAEELGASAASGARYPSVTETTCRSVNLSPFHLKAAVCSAIDHAVCCAHSQREGLWVGKYRT